MGRNAFSAHFFKVKIKPNFISVLIKMIKIRSSFYKINEIASVSHCVEQPALIPVKSSLLMTLNFNSVISREPFTRFAHIRVNSTTEKSQKRSVIRFLAPLHGTKLLYFFINEGPEKRGSK